MLDDYEARKFILNDIEFLKTFSWQIFDSLRETSFLLLGTLMFVAFILELLFSSNGENKSGGFASNLVKCIFLSLVLVSFQTVIEGAKEFIWAVELHIHKNSPIENTLLRFEDISKEKLQTGFFARVTGGATGLLVQYLGATGMWAMSLLVNFKLIFFQFVWFFIVVSAPLVIPLGIISYFDNLLSIYVYLITFLLLLRIPWAILSLCMKNLVEVAEHNNFGGFTTGVLFLICLMMSWALPGVLSFIFFRSSTSMRGIGMGVTALGAGIDGPGPGSGGSGNMSSLGAITSFGLAAATAGSVSTDYFSTARNADLPINFDTSMEQ